METTPTYIDPVIEEAELNTSCCGHHNQLPDMPAIGKQASRATAIQVPTPFWGDVNKWQRASLNTLNCLIGCTLGDFAMIIHLQHAHPGTPMWLQMTLAIIAGLLSSIVLETILLNRREKLPFAKALRVALGMSLLSMIAMELAMNATDFMLTGGGQMIGTPQYWLAFIPAAIMGFLVPLPYNYYQLKKNNKACH